HRLLYGMQTTALSERFYRKNMAFIEISERRDARVDRAQGAARRGGNQHGTGTAVATGAAFLRAFELRFAAHVIQECLIAIGICRLVQSTVKNEFHEILLSCWKGTSFVDQPQCNKQTSQPAIP